ncbi:MAG TPA: hypothetical protein VMD59_14610 [Acidimicrobiales bacterium]|nr:hypothetical protein [Acidimicrobiales bacterium]
MAAREGGATREGGSAALIVSLHLDVPGGAGWFARLEAVDDPSEPRRFVATARDRGEVARAVLSWLDARVASP